MAYRKTEAVRARLAAKKDAILEAAVALIAKRGLDWTTVTVAARAKLSVGTVYEYFGDKDEIIAGIAARALARDVEIIKARSTAERYPLNALARAIEVFYGSMEQPRLVRALAESRVYHAGVCATLAGLVRAGFDAPPRASEVTAAAIFGAVCGVYFAEGNTRAAVRHGLQCAGLSMAMAEKLSA